MVLRGRRVWLRLLGVGGMWRARMCQGVRVRLQGRVAELSRAKGPGICLPPPLAPLCLLLRTSFLAETLAAFFPKRDNV